MPGMVVEQVPDTDSVSRHIDSPHKWKPDELEFIDSALFEFPNLQPESLVWRKYAPLIDDVHRMGCNRQAEQRLKGRVSWTYEGAITTAVQEIRRIRSKEGHGFTIEHAPAEGQWHIHVSYSPIEGKPLNKNDKMDLKERLRNVFIGFEAHQCPPTCEPVAALH